MLLFVGCSAARWAQDIVWRFELAEVMIPPMCKVNKGVIVAKQNPTSLLFVVPSLETASKVSEVFNGADKLANVVAY
jgi:hypothetical protein